MLGSWEVPCWLITSLGRRSLTVTARLWHRRAAKFTMPGAQRL